MGVNRPPGYVRTKTEYINASDTELKEARRKGYEEGYAAATKELYSLNPDPANFELLEAKQVNEFLILHVRYPNCTNLKGEKILVYQNVTPFDLLKQKTLDPHFGEFNVLGYKYPIARFSPTIAPVATHAAEIFCKAMSEYLKSGK